MVPTLWSGRDDPDRAVAARSDRMRLPEWKGSMPNRSRWRLPDRPPFPEHRTQFDLYLPRSYVYQRLWEQLRAVGAQTTTGDGVPAFRPVDDPYQGTVVVLPRDEREAKYERPLMVADLPTPDDPDRPPLLLVGAGAMHWKEALEIIAETRHYGLDRPQIPDQYRRLNAVEAYRIWLDMADRRRRGVRTTGYGTFPTAAQRYGRPMPAPSTSGR